MELICFRNLNIYETEQPSDTDRLEKCGNVLKYPLTLLAGKFYKIENRTFSEKPEIKKIAKVGLAIIFVIIAPISIPVTLLGILFTKLSTSFQARMKSHESHLELLRLRTLKQTPPCGVHEESTVDYRRKEPPESYEWVKGDEKVIEFMERINDVDVLSQMAQFSSTHASGLRPKDSYVGIWQLVKYATSEKQIRALLSGIANSRDHVRAIFFHLLIDMEYNPDQTDALKPKLALISKELSPQQLKNILVIQKEQPSFQHTSHELHSICLELLLKWKKELGLPPDFIKMCEKLNEYKKYVDREAQEERARGEHVIIE